MRAYSPTGVPIKGTAETLTGTAGCYGFERDEQGKLTWENDGETEIDWDAQTTDTRDGEALFWDENGGLWKESQLVLKDGDDEDDDEHSETEDADAE